MKKTLKIEKSLLLASLSFAFLLLGCTAKETGEQEKDHSSGKLHLFSDKESTMFGYKSEAGDTVIPLGKYDMCFTDTFDTYAIVLADGDFIAIDRHEKEIYQVFPFDNGPDYPAEGLFRIQKKSGDEIKIGYADIKTGKIVIEPIYDCAWSFENGKAQVSMECDKIKEDEHTVWESNSWFYIDRSGKKVAAPE